MSKEQKSDSRKPTQDPTRQARQWTRAALAVFVLAAATLSLAGQPGSPSRKPGVSPTANTARFTGDRGEIERFLAYERDIVLTPQQEKVRIAALTELPAPCCKSFPAATCCCPCNMARATWGLAKHLIVHQRAGAERVRAAVAEWHRAINPRGFSGDACFTGGCSRAFAKNGCGGMKKGELVF